MRHSIIIPLYNKEAYVVRAIDSVFAQTRSPHELIVVDDHSSDDGTRLTQERLAHYRATRPEVFSRLITMPHNRGPAAARNAGFAASEGDIISFLDADDFYHDDFCLRIGNAVEQHQAELVVVRLRTLTTGRIHPPETAFQHLLEPVSPHTRRITDVLEAVTHPQFFLGPASAACARTLIEGVGFDEGCRMYEGIDFWYRALRKALDRGPLNAVILDEPLLNRQPVENSLSLKPYQRVGGIQEPNLLVRLRDSGDLYDRRLRRMIGRRWWINAWSRLEGPWRKLCFLWRFRYQMFQYTPWSSS